MVKAWVVCLGFEPLTTDESTEQWRPLNSRKMQKERNVLKIKSFEMTKLTKRMKQTKIWRSEMKRQKYEGKATTSGPLS